MLRYGTAVFACFALMFSLSGFLVGSPLADTNHEVGHHDRVSDGSESPTTWLGRSNARSDKRVVDFHGGWLPQEEGELLPAEQIHWIEAPAGEESLAVPKDEPWRSTPVRGPPA
jgi:hypothetical protein